MKWTTLTFPPSFKHSKFSAPSPHPTSTCIHDKLISFTLGERNHFIKCHELSCYNQAATTHTQYIPPNKSLAFVYHSFTMGEFFPPEASLGFYTHLPSSSGIHTPLQNSSIIFLGPFSLRVNTNASPVYTSTLATHQVSQPYVIYLLFSDNFFFLSPSLST